MRGAPDNADVTFAGMNIFVVLGVWGQVVARPSVPAFLFVAPPAPEDDQRRRDGSGSGLRAEVA